MLFLSQNFDQDEVAEIELCENYKLLISSVVCIDDAIQCKEKSITDYATVELGLFYLLLIETDQMRSQNTFMNLTFIVNDRFRRIIQKLYYLVGIAKFPTMVNHVRIQIAWFIGRLVDDHEKVDNIVDLTIVMLKQLRGGDTSVEGVSSILYMAQALERNLKWLKCSPLLIQMIIIKFTRLAQDLTMPTHATLHTLTATLVAQLVRAHLPETLKLGRDFLRLLILASESPVSTSSRGKEIYKTLLVEILQNPNTVRQLTSFPTPSRFLICLVTPDMEFRLNFILTSVPDRLHSVYLSRFAKRYFAGTGASLYPDVVRFVCGVLIPRLEIIRSKTIVQRWALIRTIMGYIQDDKVLTRTITALLYDWPFYNPKNDQFMCVEPSILFIQKTVTDQAGRSLSSRVINHLGALVTGRGELGFEADIEELARNARVAFMALCERNVVAGLRPFSENLGIDANARAILENLFGTNPIVVAPGAVDGGLGLGLGLGELDEIDALLERINKEGWGDASEYPACVLLFESCFSGLFPGGIEKVISRSRDVESKTVAMVVIYTAVKEAAEGKGDLVGMGGLVDGVSAAVEYMDVQVFLIDCTVRVFNNTRQQSAANMLKSFLIYKYKKHDLNPALERMSVTESDRFFDTAFALCFLFPDVLPGNMVFLKSLFNFLDPTRLLQLQLAVLNHEFIIFGPDIYAYCVMLKDLSSFEKFGSLCVLQAEMLCNKKVTSRMFSIVWASLTPQLDQELYVFISLFMQSVPLSEFLLHHILTSPLAQSDYVQLAITQLVRNNPRDQIDKLVARIRAKFATLGPAQNLDPNDSYVTEGTYETPEELKAVVASKQVITHQNRACFERNAAFLSA